MARLVPRRQPMLSYSRGPDTPLIDEPIASVFAATAAAYPDSDALIVPHQQVHWTFAQLAAEVERAARGLTGLGLGPDDRIGVWATNCFEWVCLQLAAARLGAVLVNVNPAYRARELGFVLQKSRIKALFLRERDDRSDYATILREANAVASSGLEHTVFLGDPSWTEMLEGGRDVPETRVRTNDVTNIQYTSGTTGSPKGVLLTHCNLINNARVIADGLRATARDRICIPVPLYHCFGSVAGVLVSVVSGAAMILPAAAFDPIATLRAIEEHRATAIYGVPTMFIAELEHPESSRFDFSSLRTGIMAGAPCPIEVMKRVVAEMHCAEMTIVYGQTETSPVITMSSVSDDLDRRVSTVGCACANTEVKIVSTTNGDVVPAGESGELCARGYMVMKGYDGEPEATAKTIDEDGWLHTGDLAIMRPDEYFRVTGRARDLIIRGGENIYPREIEDFLYTHPSVADVQAFGVPDLRLGETVAVWIRLRPGQAISDEEIRQFCRGQIAHFKIPHYVRFVDNFPVTVTGKIQKYKMREREIEERGLSAAAEVETA